MLAQHCPNGVCVSHARNLVSSGNFSEMNMIEKQRLIYIINYPDMLRLLASATPSEGLANS